MPVELWGATQLPRIILPPRPLLGYLLLFLYLAALLYALYWRRRDLLQLRRRQWLVILLLSLLSLSVSQLFPISFAFERQLSPPAAAQNPQAILVPFGAIPFLLAGAALNPVAAMIVGFFGGLGHALWRTHQLYDPFYFALAALLAGFWLQQNYRGPVYRWLRRPPVAGALSLLLLPLAVGVAAFAYAEPGASGLVTFDWAISTTTAHILPFLAEGLLGGFVVSLILVGVPQWRRPLPALVPSPQSRSVRNRLLLNFAVFAVTLTFILVTVVFTVSVELAKELSVNQMAHDARAVSERIPGFRNQVQNLLSQYGQNELFLGDDEEVIEQQLAELTRTAGAVYRRVILVGDDGQPRVFYPNRDLRAISLTSQEEAAVADALARGAPSITAAQSLSGEEHILSFVVPVLDRDGEPGAALVGRIPAISLNDLIVGLQGTVGEGSGFIVDEQNRVIAHPDETSLLTFWSPAEEGAQPLRSRLNVPGRAYEGRASETNARELVYLEEGPDHPWKVVITVPYQVVLRLALQISSPLGLVLAIAMLLFALNLVYLGRTISSPLDKLVQASQQLATGEWNVSVPVQEPGEVGQLGQAFERMRRSMQKQFGDIKLMLDVSQDISASIDIHQGIPTVLRGALRGTGAAGARAVVLNPSGRYPLTFAEGPAGAAMAPFDRTVALMARQQPEILLSTPQQVWEQLGLTPEQELPVRSLVAIALYAKERFQGVIWLGYRQGHQFAPTELSLLRTLGNQASVLVENARLFATAEGQRRRLAAVLASTSDAVIVTDQTQRILLVNRAMARLFDLGASKVIGLPVADVLDNRRLVDALTLREDRVRGFEIPLEDERTLYAGVSTIVSNDGRVLGRVAVLHDITRLKELDEMKSEFVSTVSHDLRGPLTFMRGYVTMLPMAGEINEKQEYYIDKILGGMQQMSTLIEDLLDLGRIEAGVMQMQDAVDVGMLLQSVAEEEAPHAAAQGLRLRVEVAEDLPAIWADFSLIRRALANLVSNAIKYAPDSGYVLLRAVRQNEEVVFSVEDRGPGIPQEDQIRLFEKFYRVRQKERGGVKGSGLGLAIVKSIVERHGGRVWVRSVVGRGSIFFFSLPVNGQGESAKGQGGAGAPASVT